MQISEEMAVRLHRMMWSDMQKELGNNPEGEERIKYKERWITKHFPNARVHNSCFLCEFTQAPYSGALLCKRCPIEWPHDSCTFSIHYQESPISKILDLPARNKSYDGRVERNRETFGGLAEESLIVVSKLLVDEVNNCKDKLSEKSGLDRSRPVDDHIHEIVKNSMEAGAAEERDRIMNELKEVLKA